MDDIQRELADPTQYAPLTEWENEPSVAALKEDLLMAEQGHSGHVAKIQKWLNLREAPSKKKRPNRSSVQPKVVRRQNEWRYSALTEPFLSAEKLFKLSGVTWEDKASAEQGGLVLNSQFRTKLNRVAFVDEYIRTGVDEGTVIVRPGWKRETRMVEKEVPTYAYMPVMDEQFMGQLDQAMQLMAENPQGFSELPEELQAAAEYSAQAGAPFMAQQVGVEIVEEEEFLSNHPTVDILEFQNCYIDPNCGGDVNKANFAVISFETSKAELQADGRYTNLDKVRWDTHTPLNHPNHAANSQDGSYPTFKDEARRRIVAYEYWGFYDVHGTGELVPIVATWIGETMIRMEENPYPDQKIPLVVVKYMPVRKSIGGEPDAALLEDSQEIQGALLRGMIDLMGRSANGQTGMPKGMLDPVNRKRFEQGENYDYNPSQHPQMGIHQHTYPEIPQSALALTQMMNQDAESLTGAKAFSGGMSGEAYGDVAAGIKGLLDAASKREMSILRRFAQGMEEIGRKIVAMNAIFLSEEEVVQVTNEEYVTVLREDLKGEYNIEVDINTAEIDEARAQDLSFMLQTLGNSVPFEITKMILMEIARLKRMPYLAHTLEKFEPQPDPLEERKKELEIAKLEAEIANAQADAALAQAKAYEAQARARQLSSAADKTDLDYVEQETGTTHMRDMDKQQAQAEANQALAITKGVLDERKEKSKERAKTPA